MDDANMTSDAVIQKVIIIVFGIMFFVLLSLPCLYWRDQLLKKQISGQKYVTWNVLYLIVIGWFLFSIATRLQIWNQ